MQRRSMVRDERGIALPTPVVGLSIAAVVMAVVAFFLTDGGGEAEKEITPAAAPETSASASPSASATPSPATRKPKPQKPKVDRAGTYVVVFNNTNIAGLAGEVGGKASTIGWNVVGVDNWNGTVPANTVYYPARLEAAGKQLALDLGIKRTRPIEEGSMAGDRLTVILVTPLA